MNYTHVQVTFSRDQYEQLTRILESIADFGQAPYDSVRDELEKSENVLDWKDLVCDIMIEVLI